MIQRVALALMLAFGLPALAQDSAPAGNQGFEAVQASEAAEAAQAEPAPPQAAPAAAMSAVPGGRTRKW